MVDLPKQRDVYTVVARDYDMVDLSFHESYDSTVEFARQIESFVERIPNGASILVVGGSVAECAYFRNRGSVVTNLDLSSRMAQRVADETGVRSICGNILEFTDESFDAIWACRSLIHLHPTDFFRGLRAIHALLTADGVLGCTLFTTSGETQQQAILEREAAAEDVVYYRCLYNDEHLRRYFVDSEFEILRTERCADQDSDEALYVEAVRSTPRHQLSSD